MLELDLEQRYYKAIVRRPPFFWDKWSVFLKLSSIGTISFVFPFLSASQGTLKRVRIGFGAILSENHFSQSPL